MIHSSRVRFHAKTVCVSLAALSLSACASTSPGVFGSSNTDQLPTSQVFDAAGYDAARASVEYKPILREKTFANGDIATITVNGFKEFSGVYTVGNDGNIFLGHIGNVNVTGKTIPELQAVLRQKYNACCLVNPSVSIEREGQAFGKIVVDGAVNDAGVFEIDEVIKLTEAVALSGGTSELADKKSVMLSRIIDGQRKVSQVNLKEIQLTGANDPLIYPSDVIFVQDSKGRLIYKDFVKTIPLISAVIFASTR